LLKVDSKYTYKFTSNDLTKTKLEEIIKMSDKIRSLKNLISLETSKDLLCYLDMSKDKYSSYMLNVFKKECDEVSSHFYRATTNDVYTHYQTKFDTINDKITFRLSVLKGHTTYKRKTGIKKAGDIKSYNIEQKSTDLTKTLTYLARYGNINIVEYLTNQLIKDLEPSKRIFYDKILNYLSKYTYERLMKLATSKRTRVINKYNKPIVYKSTSFRGRTRLKDIISYNKNEKSIISTFINLSWLKDHGTMFIPVKYSKEHYGEIERFHKTNPDYEYNVSFTRKGKVTINICVDGERELPINKEILNNIIGIDVNQKHNLFTLSDGKTFDYNRVLFSSLCKELNKTDILKSQNNEYLLGKKRDRKISSTRNVIKHSMEEIIVETCKYLKENGYDHVVFENLTGFNTKTNATSNEINYNRIVRELHLSSLKDTFKRISAKYGISVSLVHSEYTSKMCSLCGCIHNDNRKEQESFCCVNCGHTDNADLNAAKNIKNRVMSTVLTNLLKQDAYLKTFTPKPLKRFNVKQSLINAFPDNQDDRRGHLDMNINQPLYNV
jgi:IS605 OrfB family transposase